MKFNIDILLFCKLVKIIQVSIYEIKMQQSQFILYIEFILNYLQATLKQRERKNRGGIIERANIDSNINGVEYCCLKVLSSMNVNSISFY